MKPSPKKLLLILWLVFSIAYVGYTQYRYWQNVVAGNAYNQGLADAVAQVIQQAQKCEPFTINVGETKTELIGTACLQKAK